MQVSHTHNINQAQQLEGVIATAQKCSGRVGTCGGREHLALVGTWMAPDNVAAALLHALVEEDNTLVEGTLRLGCLDLGVHQLLEVTAR